MKQPEDNKTKGLPIDPFELAKMWLPEKVSASEQKRGRGRPRVENPLTPAERARRYRERRAEARSLHSRDDVAPVTENDNKVWLLELELQQARQELESYRQFAE